jgi:oligopeptide/dipeptide ABC transporter ATP-binding protein
VLVLRNVTKTYAHRAGAGALLGRHGPIITAVGNVSLAISPGDTLGIVGETGSGKTTLARLIVGLVKPTSGAIEYRGCQIAGATGRDLRKIRRKIQLVYQDPYSSLNPAMTVGQAIGEPVRVHRLAEKGLVSARVEELMSQVGLYPNVVSRLPRELSGGQRQRVAIARALAVDPDVLIADEAVSALDVSVQAQVLTLLAELQAHLGLTLIFVSHQLATVAQLCARVGVMYRGQLVEEGPTQEVFSRPRHGYTASLLRAHPGEHKLDLDAARSVGERTFKEPPPLDAPGCPFRHRCEFVESQCETWQPSDLVVGAGHRCRCVVLAQDGAPRTEAVPS